MDFKLLFTFEISSDHHFQHLKELSVRDETVFVHVIDLKGDLINLKGRKRENILHFNLESLSPLT